MNAVRTHNQDCMCFYSHKPFINQDISPQTPISLRAQVGVHNSGFVLAVTRWNERRCTPWQRCLVLPRLQESWSLQKQYTVCSFICACLFKYEFIHNASISSYSSALIKDSVRSWVGKCTLSLIARRAQAGAVTFGREQAKWSHARWYY